MTTFGDLRSILYGAPTEDSWELLCELLDVLMDDPETDAERTRHYVGELLERWPAHLRVMPRRWLGRLMSGQRAELATLARVISLRNQRVSDAQLGALARSEALASVEELDLCDAIRGATLEALMASAWITRLRTLRLQNNALSLGDLADPARWLRTSPCLNTLETLMLGFNQLNDRDLEALASVDGLRALRALELHANQLQHVRALFGAPGLEGLERLSLKWNPIADLARALEASALRELRELDLSATGMDDSALRALAEGQAMPRLSTLRLERNPAVTDAGMQALAGAKWMERLEQLSLASTSVHAAGLQMLVDSGRAAQLTHLNLMFTGVDDAAMEVLSAPGAMPALRSLNLTRTLVTARGASVLASSELAERLETLNLSRCEIGEEGLAALATSERFGRLKSLSLSLDHNRELAGADQLARASWLSGLESGPLMNPELVRLDALRALAGSAQASDAQRRAWTQLIAQRVALNR
jgi:hypothetical protein